MTCSGAETTFVDMYISVYSLYWHSSRSPCLVFLDLLILKTVDRITFVKYKQMSETEIVINPYTICLVPKKTLFTRTH